MVNIYIDESGSMTANCDEYKQPFFIISVLVVKDERCLKRNLKRFISCNFKVLKKIDVNHKMFCNDKFLELKGAVFNSALKRKFVEAIIKNNCFEIYFIKLLNNRVKPEMLKNKARAFNYLLKLFFQHNLRNGNFKNEPYFLQIDERNIKTQAKNTLVEYLNTELILNDELLTEQVQVKYFDSTNNKFIQIADVFANLYYSHCMTNAYGDVMELLRQNGLLKEIFTFPKKDVQEY